MTKLTGRFIEFEMKTLTFDEYICIKKFFGKPIVPDMEKEFLQYIIEGGFPLAVKYDSYEDKMTYVDSVIEEIFEKDIKQNNKIRKKGLFRKVLSFGFELLFFPKYRRQNQLWSGIGKHCI